MGNNFKLTARKIAENFLENFNYENYLKYKDTWIDELENDIENYKDQELQKENIKAQIEILSNINKQDGETALWQISIRQVKLEQQLKDLEDESKTD
jgi:hypothetical protein